MEKNYNEITASNEEMREDEKAEALREAFTTIRELEDTLDTLRNRLTGLSGAAEAGQFALNGEMPCEVAEKLLYHLSENLLDEAKRAGDAADGIVERRRASAAYHNCWMKHWWNTQHTNIITQ